jgi:hypothetical protein
MAVLKHDEQHAISTQDSASDLCQLSTQTVFSVLDHLTQWARHKFQALNAEKLAQNKPKGGKVNKICEYFLVLSTSQLVLELILNLSISYFLFKTLSQHGATAGLAFHM